MNRRSLVLVALGIAELGFGTPASAQHRRHGHHGGEEAPATPPTAAPDPEEAEYQSAIETANRGQREEALAMFRAIFERTHAPRAQARMGTTEIQLGRWLAAEEHLQGALAASQDAWVIAHRTPLVEALGRVQQNLADLEVACPVEGAAVSVNGQSVGTVPLAHPVRVVRGNVTIDVTAPGYEPARQMASVTSANARAEVLLVRGPALIGSPIQVTSAHSAPRQADGTVLAPVASVAQPSSVAPRTGRFRFGFDFGLGFESVGPIDLSINPSIRLGWQFGNALAFYLQTDLPVGLHSSQVVRIGNGVMGEWHFNDYFSAAVGPSVDYVWWTSGNRLAVGVQIRVSLTLATVSASTSGRRYGLRLGVGNHTTFTDYDSPVAFDLHVGYEWY